MKDQSEKAKVENEVIVRVVEIRNQVAHSTGGINQNDFSTLWSDLEKSIKKLGGNVSLLHDLRNPKKVIVFIFSHYDCINTLLLAS